MLTLTQAAATAKNMLPADMCSINTPRSDVIMLGMSELYRGESVRETETDLFKFRVYF